MIQQFNKLFNPGVVAAIGASNRVGSVGYSLIKNLKEGDFRGKIYPVNIKHSKILGEKAYKNVKEVPEKIDLAVIATPAPTVVSVVEECGKAGIESLVIITAGFNEMGAEGQKRYEELEVLVKKYNLRIIGPNCLGIIRPSTGLNASFATKMPLKGQIALISQSGAICTSILDWSVDQNVGFSYFLSIGAMVDVDFADLIDYFATDPSTRCILIYMESIKNARRFISAARAFARQKPIIVLKSGRSNEGAQAAQSHTGAMAGNDAVFNAAFRRAGIIRVDTVAQLFHMAKGLAMQQLPKGSNLAIITNAGGPAVLATDYLVKNGGTLAGLSPQLIENLNSFLPTHWSHGNPIDVLGDAGPDKYKRAIEACLKEEQIHGLLVIFTPQGVSDPAEIARIIVDLNKNTSKTIIASWMGETDVEEAREILEQGQIPNYRYPESAVDVYLKMVKYSRNIKLLYETPRAISEEINPDKKRAEKIINSALKQGKTSLDEWHSKQLLNSYNIPTPPSLIISRKDQLKEVSTSLKYPLVMKILGDEIAHKTDIGGVILNIRSEVELLEAFEQLQERAKNHLPPITLEKVLVEEMIKKPIELLIGAHTDPIFGPTIVFGRGGVETELHRDINMGLPPLNRALASHIIQETKVHKLLQGFRNVAPVPTKMLETYLVKFAYMVMDFPEIFSIDINPFLVDQHGAVAVDAHVTLNTTVGSNENYNHLSIPPYPDEFTKKIKLKNGQEATLRSIKPEDEPMEEAMYYTLSKQTIYQRFFSYFSKPTHEDFSQFTNIDYDREIAIIAEVEKGNKSQMVGVVRLVCDPWNESAEYAIVVSDDWQGLGLGNQLTDFIIQIAKKRGIKKIYADVLSQNEGMLHMFKKRKFKISNIDFNTKHVELVL